MLSLVQSYGIEHLLTFANLKQLGLLEEQQPGETLTVMESKVGKLVNDKTAGENVDECSLTLSISTVITLTIMCTYCTCTG